MTSRAQDHDDDLCWHTTRNIILNVYDIHDSNSWLYNAGLGFYHSGIEISINSDPLGYEYSFSTEGVIKTKPRLAGFGVLRTQIKLGTHKGTYLDIHRVVNQLAADQFAVGKYDIITCNCNHFTDAFAMALLKVKIPGWINRLAYIGSTVYYPPQDEEAGEEIITRTKDGKKVVSTPAPEQQSPLACMWLCGLDLHTPQPSETRQKRTSSLKKN